jgi:hypothetical protein
MPSQYKWMDYRALLGLAVAWGACGGYEPPPVAGSTTSSASSSGMGGTGGTESSSSSSSSGDGGAGGVGGAITSVGGAGGGNSSGGGSGGTGGSGPTPLIDNCGSEPCNTTAVNAVCCMPLASGSIGTCENSTGLCVSPNDYVLKCDDKADCGENEYCCLKFGRATCTDDCTTDYVCKTNADCPMPWQCTFKAGSLTVCQQL